MPSEILNGDYLIPSPNTNNRDVVTNHKMSVAQDVIAVKKVPIIESRFNDCIIKVAEITINYWRPIQMTWIEDKYCADRERRVVSAEAIKGLIKLKTNKLQAMDGKEISKSLLNSF